MYKNVKKNVKKCKKNLKMTENMKKYKKKYKNVKEDASLYATRYLLHTSLSVLVLDNSITCIFIKSEDNLPFP